MTFKGTRYKSKYYLGIYSEELELLKIIHLVIIHNEVFVVCRKIKLNNFDSHFRAFEVGSMENNIFIHLYPLNNGKTYCRIKRL